MEIEQKLWTRERGWEPTTTARLGKGAQLVILFGGSAALRSHNFADEAAALYPRAHIMGCSTAGEIYQERVLDDSVVMTAIRFEHTDVQGSKLVIRDAANSLDAGRRLAKSLLGRNLAHVLVLSDGLLVNGSDLVEGFTQHLPEGVTVTGGLSADGERFKSTLVMWDGKPEEGAIAALGFYGKGLRIGYGSLGGWDPFGPERTITRSDGNILYEMDGRNALDLYKKYLGEYARDLPASGLLFPLLVRTGEHDKGVVRTILSVDEAEQSMTFAGDMPQGAFARLMKANFDRLIDGATGAARINYQAIGSRSPDLALLISCVGRKLVLKQRTEEEVEAVREVLGRHTVMAGFYSYGEISPFRPGVNCELHNQTMTITTFSET